MPFFQWYFSHSNVFFNFFQSFRINTKTNWIMVQISFLFVLCWTKSKLSFFKISDLTWVSSILIWIFLFDYPLCSLSILISKIGLLVHRNIIGFFLQFFFWYQYILPTNRYYLAYLLTFLIQEDENRKY